jgi:hypothetical protein
MVLVVRQSEIAFSGHCSQGSAIFAGSILSRSEVVKRYPVISRFRQGDAYVVVDDRDLEFLVRHSIQHKMQIGC